ncbi:hypothetical protein AB1Y20_009072 [Prymnesium parvum]|uniref:Mre11 DNA-binding domain-containing protein n=1 Tax=Prymnesium parvum TaxID=97485 RepID=A0AB34K3X6_PRYPA
MHALAESSENQFIVMQPGSTVATSLVEGEAKPKHVALLQIRGEEFKIEAVPLRSVRPFAIKEVVLRDFDEQYELHREEGMMRLFEDQVNELLAQLAERTPEGAMDGHLAQLHAHPLVRLKVDYSGYSTCNPQKFGQRFVDKVANPKDILLFQRTKVRRMQERAAALEAGGAASDQTGENEEEDPSNTIQCLVAEFLHNTKSGQLRLLSEAELNQAVFHEFVLKDNKGAIAARVNAALKRTQTYLEQQLSRDALPPGREQREQAVEERMRRHGAPPDEALAVDGTPLGPVEDAIRVIARARAENHSDVSGPTRSLEGVVSPARGSSRCARHPLASPRSIYCPTMWEPPIIGAIFDATKAHRKPYQPFRPRCSHGE